MLTISLFSVIIMVYISAKSQIDFGGNNYERIQIVKEIVCVSDMFIDAYFNSKCMRSWNNKLDR